MKLQILIPQYKETETVIKPLLDSIEIQQNVDLKNDVGVIIVNDGTDVLLSRDFLDRYSFQIDYYLHEHRGVSATRNACLDYATADYVMFCDADDMFYNACGLYIVFREMTGKGFDTLVSSFIEELRDRKTGEIEYVTHELDSTFVHGKVHRRQFLIDNDIRWGEGFTLHEDGYFHVLCHRLANTVKHCTVPFYLWKWRDNSVCREKENWVINTYDHLIRSNKALIKELLKRGKEADARHYYAKMLCDTYFMMNQDDWDNQESAEHRDNTEREFRDYCITFGDLHNEVVWDVKGRIEKALSGEIAKQLPIKSTTFVEWISYILQLN